MSDVTMREYLVGYAAREKLREKRVLRDALARRDFYYIFSYCVAKHPKSIRAVTDMMIYGSSERMVTEKDAEWAMRYFHRLMGKRL